MKHRALALAIAAVVIVASGYGIGLGLRAMIDATAEVGVGEAPTSTVRRGDVHVTVTATGDLQGGGAAPLIVPRAGTGELPITFLLDTGTPVEAGDVVAEFDSSGQEYDLLEAEADLEEAEQELLKAEAESRVALEDARLLVITTGADLRISELDQRNNDFVGTVQRRQKEIELERARNRYEQAVAALAHLEVMGDAGLAVQRAAVDEARAKAQNSRRTMADLTLRAPSGGFVELEPNMNGLSFLSSGMQIPTFQLGDLARPGQTVATIPDMSAWDVTTEIPETDRTFLEVGQPAVVRPKGMPGQEFAGRISLLGGAAGSAWNRTFNCRIALEDVSDDFRPGMTVDVTINVERLERVLWVPSQAVFEREGRWFVYRRAPEGFITHEVSLIRRTESQAVVTGIEEGAVIALAEPGQPVPASEGPGGPLGALPL